MTKETPKHGLYIEYYDSGHTRVEISYKYDELHGNYYEWYENGQKKLEGNYKDGKKDGKQTEWYENGKKKKEKNYKDHKLHGKLTSWYGNGLEKYEENYKDGKQDGIRIQLNENIEGPGAEVEYYPDGSVKWKYEPDGYSRYGNFASYYSNGNIESLGKVEREEEMIESREYDDYMMAALAPRMNIGLWSYWYENGRIETQCSYAGIDFYGEAVRDGLYIEYYNNGQKKIEKTYKAIEDCWSDFGYEVSIRMLSWKYGKETRWYANGQKKLEGNYKEIKSIEDECEDWLLYRRGPSLKHGKFTVWDKNGQIVSEANYKDGEDENDIPF